MGSESARVIELVFKAIDEVSAPLRSMGGHLENFASGLDDVVAPITAVSDKLLLMEGALGAAAAALGVFAVKQAIEFQAATLDLQKVLSDTDGDIRQFQQSAIDLSNTFGVSASQVLQSTANFKQAGFSAAMPSSSRPMPSKRSTLRNSAPRRPLRHSFVS